VNLSKHWAAQLDDYVIDLAWAPGGAQLAAASAAGPVSLLAAADGAAQHVLAGHEQGTNCLGFAPASGASPVLATGGQDGAVKLWDAASGQHLATAPLGPAWVEHLAWRPRGAAGAERAAVLAAASGRKLGFIGIDGSNRPAKADAPKTIAAVAWGPGGGCVAVAAFGGVRLWDGDDLIVQKELPYANGIQALVWSPDGKWLVSGNQDPSVHLWQPESEFELHMSGYAGKVKHLSFDHTSRWLATSGGRDACVWDCSGAGPANRPCCRTTLRSVRSPSSRTMAFWPRRRRMERCFCGARSAGNRCARP